MASLEHKIASLVGESIVKLEAASGGDINSAFAVTLVSGRRLFAKTHPAALPEVFTREAEGLAWLAEAKALRVPEVVAACDADEHGPACLVLEHFATGSPNRRYADTLGRGLAALHRFGAPAFGHVTPNYLATLPQDNTQSRAWPAFYAERRLAPLVDRAAARGLLSPAITARFQRLFERIETFCGPPEPPARLHGDLWNGNVLVTQTGDPVLIDPAVYGGHREIDLAMMHLFAGFSRRAFDAYHEAYPLAPEHEQRLALYQLYPLLVHVNLFGGSYVSQLDRALARYVA